MTPRHTLFVFIDGLGMPSGDLDATPLSAAPCLVRLLRRQARPIDACLGVEGLPQSATGQTALLTGRNAARLVGEHRQGFPNRDLRRIAAAHNVFLRFLTRGRKATFANAYVRFSGWSVPVPLRSVTTVAALAAFGETRTRADLLAGRAVYHDLTRETLRGPGSSIPVIEEEEAAGHLLAIAREHHFTLFEFFLTDVAGHRGDLEKQRAVLQSLDRFLCAILDGLRPRTELLVICSDHGNIEDPTTSRHTTNPVPLIAVGCGSRTLRAFVRSITDVTPALLAAAAPVA